MPNLDTLYLKEFLYNLIVQIGNSISGWKYYFDTFPTIYGTPYNSI